MNYLYRLMKDKIWLPTMKRKTHQSSKTIVTIVIIFDYDDTLFCTSYVAPTGVTTDEKKPEPFVLEILKRISKLVVFL